MHVNPQTSVWNGEHTKCQTECETQKQKARKKIVGESELSHSDGSVSPNSIKNRLSNNSGTPRKLEQLRKDAIPSKHAQKLRKVYEAEGKRMASFLKANKDKEQDKDDEDEEISTQESDSETEVHLKKVNTAVESNPKDNGSDDNRRCGSHPQVLRSRD